MCRCLSERPHGAGPPVPLQFEHFLGLALARSEDMVDFGEEARFRFLVFLVPLARSFPSGVSVSAARSSPLVDSTSSA